MVFKSNFIAIVKCDGKVLREQGEFVTLPFGSEYSIVLKNLDSRSAVVSVSIDGKDVLDGNRLIVRPNKELELKGFKKGNKVTNKFKFIQKTDEIVEHRGDRLDDGIIRVEYTFEKKIASTITYNTTTWYSHPWGCRCSLCNNYYGWYDSTVYGGSGTVGIQTSNVTSDSLEQRASYTMSCDSFAKGGVVKNAKLSLLRSTKEESIIPKSDEGITVKGSDNVDQSFIKGNTKELEETSNVITLRLRGTKDKIEVTKPVTVESKLQCETCGRKNKSSSKYCSNCGTFL